MFSSHPGSRFASLRLLVALAGCLSLMLMLAVVPAPVAGEDGCEEGFERAPGQRACTAIEPDITLQEQPRTDPEIQPRGEETPEIGIQPQGVVTPDPGSETMPPSPTAEPTTGLVRVYTVICPPTYSGGLTSLPPCSPLPGALISVAAQGNPVGAKHTAMYNTQAQASFTVPAGAVTIYQAPPYSVASMRVWCAEYNKGGTPFTVDPTAVGSMVTYTVQANQTVHCYWQNIAHFEAVDFYFAEMHPWVCPLDPVTEIDALQESCGPATGPVTFSAMDEAGTVWDARAVEGGSARFDELPAGALSMSVHLPEGVEDAFVACQAVDARGATVGDLAEAPVEIGGESATWRIDLAEGSDMGGGAVCQVFLFGGAR